MGDNPQVRSNLIWLLVVVVAVAVGGLIPVAFNPNFYFVDDTQSGAIGQWFEIGRRLLDWDWSLINPTVWQSGNYIAEGAWGVFSPVLWLVGLGSHVLSDFVAYVTIVKIVFMIVAATGAWLLARSYGASAPWAAVVGIAVPLTGFTLYMDAASWVNGFMAWSMVPFAWALARRAVFQAKSPLLAAIACFGVVGIGYVHATLMLAIVLGATIVEALVHKHRASIVRAFAVATVAGAFAIVVHLPTLLTAPVTGRSTGVFNTGTLTVDLGGLATAGMPVGVTNTNLFGNLYPNAPLMYIAWFLPLLAFVRWGELIRLLRQRLSLPIVLGAALLLVLLPSDFGPLRFPIRLMSYVSLCVLIIAAVAFSKALLPVISKRRLYVSWGVVALSMFFAAAASPAHWKSIALSGAIIGAAVLVVYRLLNSQNFLSGKTTVRTTSSPQRALALVGSFVVIISLVLLVPQHYIAKSSPLRNYAVPSSLAELQSPLVASVGDVLVVGAVEGGARTAEAWQDTLVGNLFYIPEASVQNAYSAVYYPAYQNALCMAYNGFTCPELYQKLFEPLPETGELLVDALGVSTVQTVKLSVPEALWSQVPDGWTIVEDTEFTRLIVRDQPVVGAGSVVWESDGTEVTVLDSDTMGVQFRVDSVGADGGSVALSRLAWPGYQADGAEVMDDPIDGFLMGVSLDAASEGTLVSVRFVSVGWPAQSIAGVMILVLLLGWGVLRRRNPRSVTTSRSGDRKLSALFREECQIG